MRERSDRFSEPRRLSVLLSDKTKRAISSKRTSFTITPEITKLFAHSAVEIWERAVHSFLVSVALSESSEIWASVSGYYASHYAVRALAHVLGYFHLHSMNRNIILNLVTHQCQIDSPKGQDGREHWYYWKVVASDLAFANNLLFNLDLANQETVDSTHRTWANYVELVDNFAYKNALDDNAIKKRIREISEFPLIAPPFPGPYPDVQNVQLIAYHRIVTFRAHIDNGLGKRNHFWNSHRNPAWCRELINFQVAEPQFMHE